ncbi:retrovirus-related pol polyprotein from transposon TNT 1-94, partial [Tanacetum coccineum]
MAEIGCNWARIGPSKSSQSLSIAHKWAVDWAFKVFTVFIIILLGFPGPSDGLRLHSIVFFSSGSGLTADSSVLTLTLAFLDFGLDFAQSFPFHAQFCHFGLMAHPAQNINHSAFRSMFEREKLSGNNFNDWFCQLKLVLRVEKKMYVIEQPIPPAPAADSAANVLAEWNAVYDAHNEVACLMLGSMTPELHRQFETYSPYEMLQELRSMFEKQAGVERFDLIQTFHACKQEEGKSVSQYILKMKGYVEQLERLGYVLPQDLSVGLILNGLTSDFAGFVRNYNMHNMGKTIGELHALLIEYEKGLPKKAATPQVMAIQGGRIQKANKKSQNAKGNGKGKGKGKDKSYIPKPKNPKLNAKEHPTKNDACHHCKEVGHWKRNCPVYLAELMKNKKQVGTTS